MWLRNQVSTYWPILLATSNSFSDIKMTSRPKHHVGVKTIFNNKSLMLNFQNIWSFMTIKQQEEQL